VYQIKRYNPLFKKKKKEEEEEEEDILPQSGS